MKYLITTKGLVIFPDEIHHNQVKVEKSFILSAGKFDIEVDDEGYISALHEGRSSTLPSISTSPEADMADIENFLNENHD